MRCHNTLPLNTVMNDNQLFISLQCLHTLWLVAISLLHSSLNPFTLIVPKERIVCYFYTFENNLRIKGMFAKYLNESCFVASN